MIDILLATYNGEKYIRTQLDSILGQTEKDFRILVRDDGSTDHTVEILREYENKYGNIQIIEDDKPSRGAAANFFELMKHAAAEYVMFCDQDDCWLPNKIEVSLRAMKNVEGKYGEDCPLLIYTAYKPVDEDLHDIDMKNSSNMVYKHYDQLNRLLIQNYITGCTMMINKAMCEIASVNYEPSILMHDWWIALGASAMGHIIYVDEVTMKYRQHQDQSVGAIDVKSFNYRLKKFMNPETKNMDKKCVRQAQCFLKYYGKKLTPEKRKEVALFANIEKYPKFQRMNILLQGKYLKSDLIRVIGQLVYV